MSPSSPTSSCRVPLLDQLTDLALWEAEPATDPVVAESALIRRLAAVPDQRSACGLRHPPTVILTLTACATLVVGSDSVAAIRQWAARISQAVLERLGAYRDPFTGRFTVPSERTFRRVLAELDADALDAAISGYMTDVVRREAPAPQIPDTPGPAEREQRRPQLGRPNASTCEDQHGEPREQGDPRKLGRRRCRADQGQRCRRDLQPELLPEHRVHHGPRYG